MTIYQPGDATALYADILPARIEPLPPGVPSNAKLRIIVTSKALTIGWQSGRDIERVDIPLTEEPTGGDGGIQFRGGTVAGYTITKSGSCACGATRLQGWRAWPELTFTTQPSRPARVYGIPPQRFSRA